MKVIVVVREEWMYDGELNDDGLLAVDSESGEAVEMEEIAVLSPERRNILDQVTMFWWLGKCSCREHETCDRCIALGEYPYEGVSE